MDATLLKTMIEKLNKRLEAIPGMSNDVAKVLLLRDLSRECNRLAASIMQNFELSQLLEIVDLL